MKVAIKDTTGYRVYDSVVEVSETSHDNILIDRGTVKVLHQAEILHVEHEMAAPITIELSNGSDREVWSAINFEHTVKFYPTENEHDKRGASFVADSIETATQEV